MSRRKRPASRRRTGALAAITSPGGFLVLLLLITFAWHAWQLQFTQDDAYISLRYARNLVEGKGLVFNEGERVEGYSNFTWTLLLALFLKLGAPAVETSRMLGIVFGVLSVLFAARLARSLERRWGPATGGAAALVAGNCAFALWSTGGLETALYTFLVTAGLERGVAPGVGPTGRRFAPALLCLAALSRPDGPLVFVLWFALRTIDTVRGRGPLCFGDGRRGLVQDAVIFAAPLLPYGIWKLAYYGDLLPNTYYAKAGVSAVYLSRGIDDALDWFRAYGAFGVAPLLAVISLLRERWNGVEARLLAIWLGVAAYIVVIGGDVLYLHRFWLPVLPIGAVLVARGATWVAERVLPGRSPLAPVAAVLACLALAGFGVRSNLAVTLDRRQTETLFVDKMRTTGQWLREHLEPGSSIAITTIGAIAYESRLKVIDMLGLTDREVAREPELFPGLEDTWREVKYNARSVLRREPDAILFSTHVRPSSAAERALYLYRFFHEAYFPLYYRASPLERSVRTVHMRRRDAPPFHDDRVETRNYAFLDEYIEGHVQQGRYKNHAAALEHFQRAAELAPEEFHAAYEWYAATLDQLGDSRAPAALERAVANDDHATVATGRLAVHYLEEGRYEEAEALLHRIAEINPYDNTPWSALSEIHRRREEYEDAVRCMRRSLELWMTNEMQWMRLGQVATLLGDVELARGALQQAAAISPEGAVGQAARRGLQTLAAVENGTISLEEVQRNSR